MRCPATFLFLAPLLSLATALVALPVSAQSPALKEAAQRSTRLVEAGKLREAEAWAKKAVALAEKEYGAEDPTYALTLHNLAIIYNRERDFARVEPAEKRALAIYEKTIGPDNHVVAASLNDLLELYRAESRFADAEAAGERALAIDEKVLGPDNPDLDTVLFNLAGLYDDEGRYGDAERLFKRALAIDEKGRGVNDADVAGDLNDLAALYLDQGRYGDAEPLFERALAIRERARGPASAEVAQSLNNLAELYRAEDRLGDAEPLYRRAIAIDEKALGPRDPDLASDLHNLADLYRAQGRWSDAEPLFKRALAIDEKALDPNAPGLATDYGSLGSLYHDERRFNEAEPLDKHALTIDEKTLGADHPSVATDLVNLAALFDREGRYADAEPLYRRALAIEEKTLGPDHPDLAIGLSDFAAFFADQSRYADALPLVERAAAIRAGRASGGREPGRGQRSELRHARYVFVQELAIAAHLVATGSADAPRLREEGFAALQWSKASDTAAALAHMAARFAAGSTALAALVRAQQEARDRLDAIEKQLLAAVSKPPSQHDAETEDRLRGAAGTLRQQLRTRDAELAATFPAYVELTDPKPLGIAEAQRLLAPDEALLAFVVGAKESFVGVVGRERFDLEIVPVAGKALSDAVRKLRHSLDPAGLAEAPPFEAGTAYQLYQQLLAPVDASLKDVKHLYVVTDGALESLPLGVLLTGLPAADTLSETEALRAAPWLARRYAVSVLPSVSSLKALRRFAQASRAPLPFFGVGDPLLRDHPPADDKDEGEKRRGGKRRGAPALVPAVGVRAAFRGGNVDLAALRDLPSLPETAGELAAEAALFKAGPDALLLRAAATVTAVKRADLASRRIVAFATHGLLAGDVGIAEPGLVMTPPAKPTAEDDGLLKASEVAQLTLNADLVILSACNTAASDGTPGAEGFSGLSKAFLYAGARSLLVSHWSVVSGATAELMTRLATHLDEGVGRAEALRRAELDLMSDQAQPDFAHPLYWAPFVLVGEGS